MNFKLFLFVLTLCVVLSFWYMVDSYQGNTPGALRGNADQIASSDVLNVKSYNDLDSRKERESFLDWISRKSSPVLNNIKQQFNKIGG